MPASDAFLKFQTIGHDRFQEMIENQEHYSQIVEETKATTVRLPAYKIDALDTFATGLGITRQALISNLIESALGDAITGFCDGFCQNFTDYHSEHSCFEWLSRLDHASEQSRDYLYSAVKSSFGMEASLNA